MNTFKLELEDLLILDMKYSLLEKCKLELRYDKEGTELRNFFPIFSNIYVGHFQDL